jgi:magnesium transporter
LHPLALEDVVNVHQRPKIEQYTGNIFVVTRMLRIEERLESEQLSIFVGSNYVLTFQEALPGDCFGPLRDRLRNLDPAIHDHGSDYLAYRLLDAVIDSYFPVLEHYGESIDALEEQMLGVHKFLEVARIHAIKQELLQVRRTVWPTRDMLHAMIRDHNSLIKEETKVYLRDCYDHTVQIIDLLETYRELGSDLRDLYLTSVSNRMNEIMKVLTIISTLFIPLTFIVGVYGMNFDPDSSPYNMPELRAQYGYPFCWALMIVISIGMLIYFIRKGWIGERFWRGKPRKE